MKKDPWFRNRLIRDGIYRAIHERMKTDPAVYLMGEGSYMKVHFDAPAIEHEFPDRIITLPISEDGNSNFAVGLSLAGLVPIVDVISSDFLYRTMDAICNTMAKSGVVGQPRTMIVRAEFLTGGPTSGQRVEALFAHVPGLRVAVPSNPTDAYSMMLDALSTKAVTIFFEDRTIEDATTPGKRALIPPGKARIVQAGGTVVVSYGVTMRLVERSLHGMPYAVIDLRTLYPLDVATVLDTLSSKRLLIVEPDTTFLGIGAELAAQVAEALPGCRIKRLGAPHATIPASRALHEELLPSAEAIFAALKELS